MILPCLSCLEAGTTAQLLLVPRDLATDSLWQVSTGLRRSNAEDSSATAAEFLPGSLQTATPFFVTAAKSILLKLMPVPALIMPLACLRS